MHDVTTRKRTARCCMHLTAQHELWVALWRSFLPMVCFLPGRYGVGGGGSVGSGLRLRCYSYPVRVASWWSFLPVLSPVAAFFFPTAGSRAFLSAPPLSSALVLLQ
ncbi:hypothetical protein RHMOL_Rhmol08G0272900 [Rhododendron molle]|uniref:Uncharacterized protein n=1 Tax=Rhododendron molle TaxID=49168 RepID=A0ACC0MSW7_RHOML|nr:hypothetical protein RHMOL_Rhmol08G0272900 [Rhododendron molle]